jgi:TRAP-type C4-dicarboxylate transport system permease small subunit
LDRIRKFDAGIARGEGAIAAVVLLSMIFLASVQALFRNLTYLDLSFANDALTQLAWIDEFLKKGTLWLAFVGASLAAREDRHIALHILPTLLNDQGKRFIRGLVGIAAGFIAIMLARAFWGAVLINGEERPLAYEVLADGGSIHVCDATAAQLEASSAHAGLFFCALRGGLGGLGIPVETPSAAAQLIVPWMFIVIAIRFFGHGVMGFYETFNPPPKPAPEPEPGVAEEPPAPNPKDVSHVTGASDADADADGDGIPDASAAQDRADAAKVATEKKEG